MTNTNATNAKRKALHAVLMSLYEDDQLMIHNAHCEAIRDYDSMIYTTQYIAETLAHLNTKEVIDLINISDNFDLADYYFTYNGHELSSYNSIDLSIELWDATEWIIKNELTFDLEEIEDFFIDYDNSTLKLIYKEDGYAPIVIGRITSNHSMSIMDALETLEIDMDDFARKQGWEAWDYEALKLTTNIEVAYM